MYSKRGLNRLSNRIKNGALAALFLSAYTISAVTPFINVSKAYADEATQPVLTEETFTASTQTEHKDWVCKYVGTPGVDERLKNGNDGLVWVDSHATQGTWFNDQQGRSYVLLANAPHTPRPDSSQCPAPQGPTKVEVPAMPSVNDPCGLNNATWVVPANTTSVVWVQVNGSLTATTTQGYVFTDGKTTHEYGKAVDSGKLCDPIKVEAPAPVVAPVCGPNNDVVTLPTAQQAPHVQYMASGWSGGKNTVTAVADQGYVINGDKSWKFTDYNVPCPVEGTITVVKEVMNDNGGKAVVSDFDLYVNLKKVTSGTTNTFEANKYYTVNEDMNVHGYEQTSKKCWVMNGDYEKQLSIPFKLQNGDKVKCVIVNDDIAPKLTVFKYVSNKDTNLTKTSKDFTLHVGEQSFAGSSTGKTVTLNAGYYNVTEDEVENYAMSTYGDCKGNLKVGEHKVCVVWNKAVPHAEIDVQKYGPDTAVEGEDVYYTFVVTNTGNVPLSHVDVEDDIAGEATYQFGDNNNNGKLDVNETWYYYAEYTIPEGQVANVKNTVTACGEHGYRYQDDNDDKLFARTTETEGFNWNNPKDHETKKKVCATDTHELDVLHPSLNVEKSGPDSLQLGNEATYTFTVTNTGDVPLSLTKVEDNLAGVGVYVSGDTDDDEMLDLDEVWVFTASYKPTTTGDITNTVEVCGEIRQVREAPTSMNEGGDNEEDDTETCATDIHTTKVYVPQVLGESTTTANTNPPQVLQDTGTPVVIAWILSGALLGLAMLTQINTKRTQKLVAAFNFSQPFAS